MDRNFLHNTTVTRIAVLAGIALAGLTGCSTGRSESVSNTLAQTQSAAAPTQVSVVPATLQVAASGSFQFSVEVLPAGASNAVTWSVSGAGCSGASCGMIDAGGRYLAPGAVPNSPAVTVTATSTADSTKAGAASVTIGPPSSAPGTFTPAGNMTTARSGHTAVLLLDGRVLIAGGDAAGSAELYDPSSGTFVLSGRMIEPRYYQTATRLANGQVLIAGGSNDSTGELYDPATGMFSLTGEMRTHQNWQVAALLASGLVLVAGDVDAELYDPATGTFLPAGPYASRSRGTTATLLADGRVLLVGGDPAQLYDPASNTFSVTDSLSSAGLDGLDQQTATLLNNGKVLIAGGSNDEIAPAGRVVAAELYDPVTGAFTATSSMHSPRDAHAAALLPDGTVLIVGGDTGSNNQYAGSLASAELYDPSTGTFAAAGDMSVPRTGPQATLLRNGDVLITGGAHYGGINLFFGSLASAELYHPRLTGGAQ
jgi:hypothetical protein